MSKRFIHGYNHEKYWKRRSIVIDKNSRTPLIVKLYLLWWIKRVDARHHCAFWTYMNHGASFATPPIYLMVQKEFMWEEVRYSEKGV